ncbi:hypothetical protein F5880DRAFT_1619319 [Lentinula raphanica]|nr:hypothetical protein F5880DRAFT_1619319 [Lentinula raphanica]
MDRILRQDIPSRRARGAGVGLAPGMADLNPAPGVGGGVPPPSASLDRAPAGTFQANRALSGEQGVVARQRARVRHAALGAGTAPREPLGVLSPHGWDSDAFPADHDLFGDDSGGLGGVDAFQRHPGGGESATLGASHSARSSRDLEPEGGGAAAPRGRGPIPPSSPASAGSCGSEMLVFVPNPGLLVPVVVSCGSATLVFVPNPGLLVPVVVCSSSLRRWCLGLGLWDLWCPQLLSWDDWCPLFAVSYCVPWSGADTGWVLGSDLSKWGGIEGEFRVLTPPVLGPPFELHPASATAPVLRGDPSCAPASQSGVEQFRAASRSQSRQEQALLEDSPSHDKAVFSRLGGFPFPHRVASQEDGGRAAIRFGDHIRRRSKSLGRMEVDPIAVGSSQPRSLAFPDPRTARYLPADPVGMLTSVHPVVSKVLAEGWQEPIPLGYFARRYNPLIPGQASSDLSTLRMGENDQAKLP